MKQISKIIGFAATFAKYAGILIVLGKTFEFFQKELAERFPTEPVAATVTPAE
jgi:hypothetical protein